MPIVSQLKIDQTTFTGLIWASAAVALPFVPFRLYVRWRVFQKLFVDDALVLFAYSFLLAFACFWQTQAGVMYTIFNVGAGVEEPPPDFPRTGQRYLNATIYTIFMYGFCLWAIKLAILLFFRRLGRNVRYQNIIWWSVFAWNVIAFFVWMGIPNWQCITKPLPGTVATCDAVSAEKFSLVSMKLQTAMDVLSDASIIMIPVSLLWTVQIPVKKKLTLGGIFSLTVFVMMASISRCIVVTSTKPTDHSWYYPGSAIEMAIAIIVACLASSRALFSSQTISQRLPIHHREQRNDREQHPLTNFGLHRNGRSSASITGSDGQTVKVSAFGYGAIRGITTVSTASSVDVLPLPPMDRIHVRNEFEVSMFR